MNLVRLSLLFLFVVSNAAAQTVTETVLHSFAGGAADGRFPEAGLIRDAAGNLYGTTYFGGSNVCQYGCGTIFKLDTSNNFTVLHSFSVSEGIFPQARLTLDSAGNLYGTTSNFNTLNDGIVFKLDTSNNLTVLHSFAYLDGVNPPAGLIFDSAGNLYGTTYSGGPNANGTIFKLDTSNNFTVLYSFSSSATDGANPDAGLVFDSAGNLYGTTVHGGTSNNCSGGCGTVFKLDKSNTLTVLHSFSGTDGMLPTSGLIFDSAGNLYGATQNGGANSYGTVFKLDTSNNLTVLHSFSNSTADGGRPYADFLTFDSAGNLYGTTFGGGAYGNGTVFELDTSNNFFLLHSFSGPTTDGGNPQAGLVLDSVGNLFGTTFGGGTGGGLGTVFKLAVTYTLTYTAGVNGTISGMSPQTVNSGGSGTAVTAVPNTCYHFVNWSDGSTANPRTDTNVTTNISVTANFAQNPPDFSLSTSPSSVTVTAGSPASYTENITAAGGFTGPVSLSISGLPAGASGTFNPNPATGASSALTITTSSATPAGSYTLTITGTNTNPALTHTSTATLVVQPVPPPSITFVRAANNLVPGAGTSVSVANMTNNAGDTLVVACRESAQVAISSVTDTAGNSYTKIANALSTGRESALFFATNVKASAANTISCNFASSSAREAIVVEEFSGVTALDSSVIANSNSATTSLPSGNLTTSSANVLLVYEVNVGADNTFTAGLGYVIPAGGSNARMAMQYTMVSSQGTYATSESWSTAALADGILAALK